MAPQESTQSRSVPGSITSAPSFQARLLESEEHRTLLLGLAWLAVLLLTIARRAAGGAVMAVDVLFYSTCALLSAGIVFQWCMRLDARRRRTLGRPFPIWRSVLSVVIDIAVPIAQLVLLELYSPSGHTGSLAAPAILGLPLVTMLSVLRLKPLLSLWTGAAAGIAHASMVGVVIAVDHVDRHQWPMLLSYSVLLLLSGVMASVIAKRMREHVRCSVDEALAAEKTARSLQEVERDLSIARDIQQGLMPSEPPAMPGFDIAGMARPAAQTGGDYYDWQKLEDGRLVVALADVTGHGIGPALVMAVCHAYARASAPAAPDPAQLLTRVNELIYKDLSSCGRFITMVIAVVAPDGTIDLVSAGHGPTLLYRHATQKVEYFGGDGMPLGIDAAEHYGPHQRLVLQPGDALLLATDGFMEWARAGDGKMFGIERLCAAFRDAAPGSARAILDGVDVAAQTFAGGLPQGDDTTAVAIKRVG